MHQKQPPANIAVSVRAALEVTGAIGINAPIAKNKIRIFPNMVSPVF